MHGEYFPFWHICMKVKFSLAMQFILTNNKLIDSTCVLLDYYSSTTILLVMALIRAWNNHPRHHRPTKVKWRRTHKIIPS